MSTTGGHETFPPADVTMEALRATAPEVAAELDAVFAATPLEDITSETGLGLNELSQVVEYKGESGTLASVLADPRCPAGVMIRGQYRRKGFEGVSAFLEDMAQDVPSLRVTISPSTREREHDRASQALVNQAAEGNAFAHETHEIVKKKLDPTLDSKNEAKATPDLKEVKTRLDINEIAQIVALQAMTELSKPVEKTSLAPPKAENKPAAHKKTNKIAVLVPVKAESSSKPRTKEMTDKVPAKPALKPMTQTEQPQFLPKTPVRDLQLIDISTAVMSKTVNSKEHTSAVASRPVSKGKVPETHEVLLPTSGPEVKEEVSVELPTTFIAEQTERETMTEPALYEYEIPQPDIILSSITENMELAPAAVEQTETLLIILPEVVQQSLVEFIELAEPADVEAVEELVVQIATATDRLHELAMADQLDGQEAVQIEELIREWYTDLLTKLNLEVDPETIDRLIESVCSQDYKPTPETQAVELVDEGLHERKLFDLTAAASSLGHLTAAMELEIARLMVRLSTKAAALA